MHLRNEADFFRRLGARGLIGFGESYQAGDWDTDELPALLTVLAAHMADLIPAPLRNLRAVCRIRRPHEERNTRRGARSNIARHYDLSDELFALFLDATMTYSSALFAEDESRRPIAGDGLLTVAQNRKIDRLLDAAGVGPGSRVLEIGTGWGSLAVRAAARGAQVRTVTLSANQRAYTEHLAAEAGLSSKVTPQLLDYRDVEGSYDAVLSVEMIEAIGREQWPGYFAALGRLLAPGGRIGLQSITMPHARMSASAATQTWITKYIFPGGLIPSARAIEENAGRAGLRVVDDMAFGPHYAETLRLWHERLTRYARHLGDLGFDPTFERTWRLYLLYSQAGFASGYLDVHQYTLERALP
ncbi:class I SAM-dependent methyltransferase [Actinospica durhamensis]|uniref:Class I SAM-dependent methyltransferase n=2 Tax=Actinospica durhamensis TaxID=1508375 RepID=A0A941EZ75_9ACTN|nr:class I SAM-dependent methyltransferase [Actinospica durhamensis]